MAKQGKHKRVDAERYPGGRIKQPHQRSKVKDVVTAQRLLEAVRRGKEDPRWGTPLGQLALEDKITATCMTAGEKWAELVDSYHRLIGTPRLSPAILERAPGRALQVDPYDEAQVRRAKSVEKSYRVASASMVSLPDGIRVARVIHELCVLGQHITYEELVHARRGLAVLAQHFGLTR